MCLILVKHSHNSLNSQVLADKGGSPGDDDSVTTGDAIYYQRHKQAL